MRHRISILFMLTLLAASAPSWGQETTTPPVRDTIQKMDGKILNGTVLKETASQVQIDRNFDGKVDETLDQNDVKSIQYGAVPVAYRQGEAFLKVGQYDEAIAQFRNAMKAPGVRPWVKDYATYYIAVAMARKAEGDAALRDKAVEAFEQILKTPDSRWIDQARYDLGQLYLSSGDKAKARELFTQLESGAHALVMRLTAATGLADLLTVQGENQEALARYRKVVDEAKGKYPALYGAAIIGQAGALIALKKYDEAEAFLKQVTGSTGLDDALMAKAYSQLGDCYRLQADAEADDKKQQALYKAALLSYLRNVVLYFKQKNEYARSLLYAGDCWKKLGEDRFAADLHNELRTKYGGTTWAQQLH